jgi:hypothetical protein
MKRFLCSLLFVLFVISASAQDNPPVSKRMLTLQHHGFGDFSMAAAPVLLMNGPNGAQFAGGFRMRTFVSKRISFDTDLVFGRDYIHGGPGLIGIPLWLLFWHSGTNDTQSEGRPFSELLLDIVIVALSAEHAAYHIPIRTGTDVSPYVSLLRYKSAYPYGDYSNTRVAGEQLSFAAGIELNHYIRRFTLSPYLELNTGYKDHQTGFNAGIWAGYYFPVK